MSPQSTAYALGGTLTEQQRLIAQAQGLEEHAKWLLDQIGVAGGQKTVDVGCGNLAQMRRGDPVRQSDIEKILRSGGRKG